MKKSIAFLPLLLTLVACSMGAHMNLNAYNDIAIGETSSAVVAAVGQPYSITRKDDDTVEYEYIERIKAGGRDLEDRRYIITIRDGVVAHKQVRYSSPAPYLYDSYEMQTSQRNSSPPSDS